MIKIKSTKMLRERGPDRAQARRGAAYILLQSPPKEDIMTRTSFLGRLDALLRIATASELAFAEPRTGASPAFPPAHRIANPYYHAAKAA